MNVSTITGMYPLSGLIKENPYPEIFNIHDLLELALAINEPYGIEVVFGHVLDNETDSAALTKLRIGRTDERTHRTRIDTIVREMAPVLMAIFDRLNHCSEDTIRLAIENGYTVTIDDLTPSEVIINMQTTKSTGVNISNFPGLPSIPINHQKRRMYNG